MLLNYFLKDLSLQFSNFFDSDGFEINFTFIKIFSWDFGPGLLTSFHFILRSWGYYKTTVL